MATDWLILGELTALAAGVALSPISVIPAIAVVVHSSRPRAVGFAFTAGWLTGKAAITTVFVQVPRVFHQAEQPAPAWTGWLRIVLGLLLIVAAVAYWRKPSTSNIGPGWLQRIKNITPAGGAAIGIALTVINLKVVLLCAAAGYAIGTRNLSGGESVLGVVYFTALAGSSAVIPVLAYSVWAQRIDRYLEGFRLWMQRRQRIITVVIVSLIGVAIIVSGVGAL